MSLPELRKGFTNTAAAMGMTAIAAMTPLSYSFADETRSVQTVPISTASTSQFALVEDSGLAANLYSRENPGVAVSVFLGTAQSTPDPAIIQNILSKDFANAGLDGPITFFFDQNDTPGTGVAYYFDGDVNGPYHLGEARQAVKQTAESYNFRKEKGLLASLNYNSD